MDGGGVDNAENAARDAVYRALLTDSTQAEPEVNVLARAIVAICGVVVSPSTIYMAAILTCPREQNTVLGKRLLEGSIGIVAHRLVRGDVPPSPVNTDSGLWISSDHEAHLSSGTHERMIPEKIRTA
jgi:hypothetical protein